MSWILWVLRALSRLVGHVRRFFGGGPPPEPLPRRTVSPWAAIHPPKWQEGKPTYINTSRGGPNAPKRQPCTCGKWVKRTYKGATTARYDCTKCKVAIIISL